MYLLIRGGIKVSKSTSTRESDSDNPISPILCSIELSLCVIYKSLKFEK